GAAAQDLGGLAAAPAPRTRPTSRQNSHGPRYDRPVTARGRDAMARRGCSIAAASGAARLAIIPALLLAAACAPAAGRIEQRYPTGELRMEVPSRGGEPDGEAVSYRKDGQVESRGTYRAGERHGLFVFLGPGGQVTRREIYVRDRLAWSSSDPAAEVPPSFAGMIEPAQASVAEEPPLLLRSEYLHAQPAFVLSDP